MRALLYLALLFTGGFALAQSPYTRGTVYLDGASALSVGNYKYIQPENTWSIPPVPQWNNAGVSTGAVGIFAFDRLMVGASLNYEYLWYGEHFLDRSRGDDQQYRINPFVRYYLLAGSERKLNLFAEFGFGTWRSGMPSSFDRDFHLGAGADVPLWPGVVATAQLSYSAGADGFGHTALTVGGNLLPGQLGTLTSAPMTRGSWTTRAKVASVSVGRNHSDNGGWFSGSYALSPSVGYFLLDGLVLSSHSTFNLDVVRNSVLSSTAQGFDGDFETIDFSTELEVRYHPWRKGRLLPFGTLALGYAYDEMITLSGTSVEKQPLHTTVWHVGAGVSYFLGQHVALEVSANYAREASRQRLDDVPFPAREYRRVALQTGLAFYFGG